MELLAAQTSDDFYEVSPNNFYNLESEQQQFPCPPYGMCDFGVENNNQNLENFLINSKSFLLRPSSQQQLTFNENNKENNEFPTLIPPYKINKEFTDPSIITKKEFNNIERQEISGGSSNDIGNNGGINGCTGNWMGEIKGVILINVSLQRSVPAPFPVQMSNIGKNNFNLEELYGINNLNNENILNNYGSLIQSNTNSYQFPQSQGYFGGGGYYSSIGNQFGDNNNFNIVNKNNKNQLIPNIWQSGGGKNLCGSSSPGVAPFVGLETSLQGIDNIKGSDIPFPFGTLQNKDKEEQLLPSNLKEEQQHQQPIQKSVTSIQALTQQILRLPAVLYADSSSSGSRKLETLLREVYGLPLVTFYVDRIGNGKPRLVERNLEQLTAHRGLPYLFICGTFIGSKEKKREGIFVEKFKISR
uniref:Glutaredoxin domain-containing protein n=1 Tax=Meloidogyne javanica TaxID=6303 RepID=A0A915N4I3_MELJA